MDTDIKRKMKIFKGLRILFIMPIGVMTGIAFLASCFGIDAYIDSFYTGIIAFVLTIIAFMVKYSWLWIVSVIGTLVTSILIKRINKSGKI